MKIISKFHDFYDSGIGFGIDPDIVYVRNKEEVDGKIFSFSERSLFGIFDAIRIHEPQSPKINVTKKIVGFCGKIYPLLIISVAGKKGYCYNIEQADKFFKDTHKEKVLKEYFKKSKGTPWSSRNRFYPQRKTLVSFFDHYNNEQNNYEDAFIKNNCPVIVENFYYDDSSVTHTINANLKDLMFFKVFDTYSAWQEVSMYVGSTLGMTAERGKITYKGEPMSMEVSDKDLLIAKGFDKFSFRKEKKVK